MKKLVINPRRLVEGYLVADYMAESRIIEHSTFTTNRGKLARIQYEKAHEGYRLEQYALDDDHEDQSILTRLSKQFPRFDAIDITASNNHVGAKVGDAFGVLCGYEFEYDCGHLVPIVAAAIRDARVQLKEFSILDRPEHTYDPSDRHTHDRLYAPLQGSNPPAGEKAPKWYPKRRFITSDTIISAFPLKWLTKTREFRHLQKLDLGHVLQWDGSTWADADDEHGRCIETVDQILRQAPNLKDLSMGFLRRKNDHRAYLEYTLSGLSATDLVKFKLANFNTAYYHIRDLCTRFDHSLEEVEFCNVQVDNGFTGRWKEERDWDDTLIGLRDDVTFRRLRKFQIILFSRDSGTLCDAADYLNGETEESPLARVETDSQSESSEA